MSFLKRYSAILKVPLLLVLSLLFASMASQSLTKVPHAMEYTGTPPGKTTTDPLSRRIQSETSSASKDEGLGRFSWKDEIGFISAIVTIVLAIPTVIAFIKRRKIVFWLRRHYQKTRLRLEEKPLLRPKGPLIKRGENDVVRYGIAVFQDTILPMFFDYVHRRAMDRHGLRIQFVEMEWNECLNKFRNEKIDVALHNLSTVIPYFSNDHRRGDEPSDLPSVFVPFFDFWGQGIFIRESVLDRLDGGRLKDIKNDLRTPRYLFGDSVSEDTRKKVLYTLLKETKAIATKGTDLEVAIDNLYDLAGLDPNAQDWEHVRAYPEDGYRMFIDPQKAYDVYCGGLIQLFKLLRLADPSTTKTILLCTGKDLKVSSANGLVTTQSFASKHPRVVRDLTETWFWSINHFRNDVSPPRGRRRWKTRPTD